MKKKLTKLGWSPKVGEREIIKAARKLTSLQRKRRDLLRRLKLNHEDVKAAKRELKAVAQQAIDVDPMMPPMRLFGEEQGK